MIDRTQAVINGLQFERETDLNTLLVANGFEISSDKVYRNGELYAFSVPKHALYKFIGINYQDRISKKLLPDEALIVPSLNKAFIFEKKFQTRNGSVDEKLQTCDFKKRQYAKLLPNIEVEYIYILNDWFKDKKYTDTLEYIQEVGCSYYFNSIPLSELLDF